MTAVNSDLDVGASSKSQIVGSQAVFKVARSDGTGRPGIELTQAQLDSLSDRPGFSKLHFGSWVSIRLTSAAGSGTVRIPAIVRRWPPDAKPDKQIIVVDRVVGVDQVVRLAIDMETLLDGETVGREDVTVERMASWKIGDCSPKPRKLGLPIHSCGDKIANRLAPAFHVVARVVMAEMTLTEQNGCLLPALAMDCLGLKSGDEIVIHAAAFPKGRQDAVHVTRRLKAYVATSETVERRGKPPSNLPALSEIWLDAGVREQMGLPLGGAVIVAPSRRYVLADNLREVAIVAALALSGVAASADGGGRGWWATLAVLVPVGLIALRVRSRLR